MSLSGLGNVIISLINGAKHVPHRTSKITRMLQESIGNTSCRTTMIAHVSPSLPFYAETLATVQLATRLHRLRKRKGKGSSTSSSGGESSCDEARIRKPRLRTAEPRLRTTALNEKLREDCPIGEPGSSDYNSSTGEESCDTVIYVGPDGAISDRDLTDNEGPPTRLSIRKSSVSSSTRSLVRKLEAIENEEAEDKDEDTVLKREVEGSEDSSSLFGDGGKEELFSEREQGEGREFSEEYTEESSYETEIEVIPEPQASSRKRLLENKGSSSSLSETSNKESIKRSKRQESDIYSNPVVKEITAAALDTLIIPSGLGPNLDIDESMNSRNSTVVIPVQSFPGEEDKLRTRVVSPETSSESSDGESIVMAKAPSFSFLTCEAVNEIHSKSLESLDAEQDLFDYEMSRQKGITRYDFNTANVSTTSFDFERDHCDDEVLHHFENKDNQEGGETTAELIENCQPHSPVSDTPDLCYVLEETREASSDDFSYDDTELEWGKQLADDAIIAEAFCEEEESDIEVDPHLERNFTGNENDVLFPELEESLRDVNEICAEPAAEKVVPQKMTHRPSSDESSAESDTDATRSYTFGTPMKMFYRLVPSPQSSSTEDELEDFQVSKSFKSKTLSPIPEFPSVESNLNQASTNFRKKRASCSYSIVSVEIDDGNTTIHVEGDKENIPMKDITNTSNKGDLRSLLQKFVAEQLRECEGEKFSSRYAHAASRHPEYRRPRTKPNRRIVPLASSDTSGNDMLLPPLVPQKRTCTETARLISSPKLRYNGEKEYDSDNAPYRGKAEDGDESSDSSMTAKTEPWCTPGRSAARLHFDPANPRLSSFSVDNVKTNVTFLGSEDENNNFLKTSDLERPCVIENCDMKNEDVSTCFSTERLSRKDSGRVEHFVKAGNSPTRRSDRTSFSSVSSFVKLTYCGSEISDAEFDKPDEPSTKDNQSSNILLPNPSNTISISVERPIIQCIPLQPETPYAPQEKFIARFHDRCAPPRIVYRLSGEFVATIPGYDATALQTQNVDGTQVGANRQYRLSGEFVATFTTCTETQNASTLALISSTTEEGNNSTRTESTDVVWVTNEPVVSTGDLTADETSGPSTPVALGKRNEKTRRFKFFGRDRGSYSSGHASDSSIGDSPGPRGRSRSLKRLKSLSSRSDAASSSGYESMRNDASHASSDSCSEKGLSRGKRKGRSRSASPGSSTRKYSPRRWFSRKSLEPVQIKVYEVDDIEKVQQAMEPNFQWQDSEQRKTRIASLRQRQRNLKEEFSAAKNRLLDENQRWSFGLKAEKELNWEDPRFIDALEVENNNLRRRISDCKSSIMMVTSFDKRTTQV
ncbi:Kinesin-like protein KIF26A [Stylophora pistillata]|uniref:Kinesin-like protein KIF26A n=2 Tax=Stylophora pistillata TaxID=50429 RepID=A0A2B4S606_STYPI|nr:Kinesin-like protein KIF26A [Stylophora pistillata]